MFDMVTKFATSMVNKIEVKNDIIKSMKLDVFGDLQASPVQLSIITKPKYGPKSLVVNSNYWNTIISFLVIGKNVAKIFYCCNNNVICRQLYQLGKTRVNRIRENADLRSR